MGISMPLTRGQMIGHDNERLAFAFTMMKDGEMVPCQISDAAMDELRERRFREVTLWTAEWSTSQGFYDALGWKLDGARREKTFAGSTFTEVRYRTQVPR